MIVSAVSFFASDAAWWLALVVWVGVVLLLVALCWTEGRAFAHRRRVRAEGAVWPSSTEAL